MIKFKKLRFILILVIVTILFIGCTKNIATEKQPTVTIAEQFGLAYAPLQIMKEQTLLENHLPGINVEWRQLSNTAAIREAMLAEEVDVGFMAIPPFLIGYDKSMEWKIFSGLSSVPNALISNRKEVQSLRDITAEDRIALPQPGSVQHILLSMAAEKEFNDAHRFDNILVSLSHPDAMNSLLAGKEITAHFTSPPYMQKELEDSKNHMILDGKDVMGKDFTFIVGVTSKDFKTKNQELYQALSVSLKEAIEFINEHPAEAASILSKAYDIEEEDILNYLELPGVCYNTTVVGIEDFAVFMERNGYISSTPSIKNLFWDDVDYEK